MQSLKPEGVVMVGFGGPMVTLQWRRQHTERRHVIRNQRELILRLLVSGQRAARTSPLTHVEGGVGLVTEPYPRGIARLSFIIITRTDTRKG